MPGRSEAMCSACGATREPGEGVDLTLHFRRQPTTIVDAYLGLCEGCYWAMIGFLEAHGTTNEVVPLKGYR